MAPVADVALAFSCNPHDGAILPRDLGEILSAAEFFDHASLQLVLRHIPGTRSPLHTAPLYMVVETAGSVPEHDADKVDRFLTGLLKQGLVEDGTVAQDGAQAEAIWQLRESISEALRVAGAVFKYDLSLPTADMYRCVSDCVYYTMRVYTSPVCCTDIMSSSALPQVC